MTTCIALLRGVNVGKGRRVPMAELRAVLADLGHDRVATLLNSGNAVFRAARGTPAKLAADIAAALARRLDVEVPVIVKSAAELDAIVADNPLDVAPAEHSRMLVAFTRDARSLASLAALEPLVVRPERFALGRRAAYLHCASGLLESRAGAALLGKPGQQATTRNWATVLKLQALAHAAGA